MSLLLLASLIFVLLLLTLPAHIATQALVVSKHSNVLKKQTRHKNIDSTSKVYARNKVAITSGSCAEQSVDTVEFHSENVEKCVEIGRFRSLLLLLPEGVRNGMASGMAAAVVKATLQPFDTIKTVQQMQPNAPFDPIRTGLDLVRSRGIGALWAGTGVTIVGSAPSVAVYFGVFNSMKGRIAAILPPNCRSVAIASAAVIGNTVASTLRVPYEVFKQRLQTGRHQSLAEAVAHSWKYEGGFLGLFASGKLTSQIVRDVPYAVITAVTYEFLQALVNYYVDQREASSVSNEYVRTNRKLQNAACGSIAGGFSTFLTTPMDVVKTRLMSGTAQYDSVAAAFAAIRREEGIHSFFKGVSSRLLHKIPANGLFFFVYEFFRHMLGVGEYYKLSS